jgi:nucleotide-binding universal stress UspA family protein
MPILICYDGSDSAKRALEVAHRTLGREHNVLLHVHNQPDQIRADSFGSDEDEGQVSATRARLESLTLERASEVVADGRKRAADLGLQVEARDEASRSSVWQTILDVAEDIDADLIVAGTHGTTAIRDDALGSVSGALVHHSHRPVLVVPTGR